MQNLGQILEFINPSVKITAGIGKMSECCFQPQPSIWLSELRNLVPTATEIEHIIQ